VSKELVSFENAAPAWAELVQEFKRLELFGKVSRGYFVESFHGEQFGLPEAVELLRDCRARRDSGKDLGYLPDEPILTVTNHDPANLYASSLDLIDERGEPLKRVARTGNLTHTAVIQAGQALLYNDRQLVTLDRRQLRRCIDTLMYDYAGNSQHMSFRTWNGYPIDVSPVASVLWELGFRYDGRRWMVWPPRGRGNLPKPESRQEEFLPYFEEQPAVKLDAEWFISRVPSLVQAKLRELIALLEKRLPSPCEWHFGAGNHVGVTYRGRRYMNLNVGQKRLRLHITQSGWVPGVDITPDTDIERGEAAEGIRKDMARVKREIDDYLDKAGNR
jgi:hypothetical protein